ARYQEHRADPQNPDYMTTGTFAVGIIMGKDLLDLGLWMFRISQVFMLLATLTFMVGYAIALPVPPRFGTKTLLIALLAVGGLNLIFQLVFKLLPLTGTMDFTLWMFVAPEVPTMNSNLDRMTPLHVLWSKSPFWECTLAL